MKCLFLKEGNHEFERSELDEEGQAHSDTH